MREVAYGSTATPRTRPAATPRCADRSGATLQQFFSDDDLDIARAKAMCNVCDLREPCMASAIERGEAYGVWGGVLLIDGQPSRFPKRRGRPPVRRIEYVPGAGFREQHVA